MILSGRIRRNNRINILKKICEFRKSIYLCSPLKKGVIREKDKQGKIKVH
jgi:hypothetical protein